MPHQSLLSIVINNYNYGRFLRHAIESALAQTYAPLEVIVVDDGSTDESRQIVSEYGNRVTPVLKPNGGQGSAFNAGFIASNGNAICFLDADDMLAPSCLSVAAANLDSDSVVKVHWRLTVVDEMGQPTGECFPDQEMLEGDLRVAAVCNGPLYDSHTLPPTSGNLWTRPFLKEVLPIPADEFDHGADVYLHALAPLFGNVACVDKELGFYREHGSNHYWRGGLSESKVTEYLGRFESCCRAMHRYLLARGIKAETLTWKRSNFNYLWLTRLRDARTDIARLVQSGSSFVLVDGNELGGDCFSDRQTVRLSERGGQYWGLPADGESAITELERFRRRGAAFIIFWWTSFWWLDHYAEFTKYLRSHFTCALENDRIIAFDLRVAPARIRRAIAV